MPAIETYFTVRKLRISKTSANGVDITRQLENVEEIIIPHTSAVGNTPSATLTYTIFGRQELSDSYIFDVTVGGNNISGSDQTVVSTIFEPFTSENFDNSDFNALFNNAVTPANTANVQKVDYSTNPNIPVNIVAIRNNIAERADVQELLHTSPGLISGRYGGKQLTGQFINEFRNGDKSYGKTPVIEHTTPYFCIFDYISGFSPEHNKANAIVISYIVDELGNLTTPDSPTALPILQQGFPSDSKFEISIQSSAIGGTEAKLLGMNEVLRSGVRVEPILYSYTASQYLKPAYSASHQLEFDVDDSLQTYDAAASGSGTQSPSTSYPVTTAVTFSLESKDDLSNYNTGTSRYSFSQDTQQPVKFSAYIEHEGTAYDTGYGFVAAQVNYRIEVSSDGTFNSNTISTLAAQTATYTSSTPSGDIDLQSNFSNFNSGSVVRVVVQPRDSNLDTLQLFGRSFQATSFASGSTFVAQSDNGQGFFFATGSAATNTTLTASISLSSKYDNLYIGIRNATAANQGFNTVTLPFTVQPGDEIKFNNDEARTFLVTAVQEPSQNTEQLLYITLDSKPNKAANKDFFAIRRYIPSSNMILMKTDRVRGTQSNGILFPEYPSARLKANYERIISDLKNKGIL
jgi:hypothetical protein